MDNLSPLATSRARARRVVQFRIGILAHSTAGFAQGYDFVTAAGLRARVSICSQGNSNRTGDSRFCGVPNP